MPIINCSAKSCNRRPLVFVASCHITINNNFKQLDINFSDRFFKFVSVTRTVENSEGSKLLEKRFCVLDLNQNFFGFKWGRK